MGRAPCCSKVGLHRGPWTPREDTLLTKYIQAHGEGHWRSLPKKAGLLRCGKSCRLRWMNYLRPDIKRGNITADEDDLIIRMHSLLGNRWSLIAGRLPGRTDNEIKNYWNTHLSKRLRSQGTDPSTHKKLTHQPARQEQKRKTKDKANHKKQRKGKSKLLLPEKPKIHLPKPVRFTHVSLARNDSFECNTVSTVSSGPGGDPGGFSKEGQVLDVPNWVDSKFTENGEISLFVGDAAHHDLVVNGSNGSDPECHSLAPASRNSLDKLYEEYLELLKTDDRDQQMHLDSFAESLLL